MTPTSRLAEGRRPEIVQNNTSPVSDGVEAGLEYAVDSEPRPAIIFLVLHLHAAKADRWIPTLFLSSVGRIFDSPALAGAKAERIRAQARNTHPSTGVVIAQPGLTNRCTPVSPRLVSRQSPIAYPTNSSRPPRLEPTPFCHGIKAIVHFQSTFESYPWSNPRAITALRPPSSNMASSSTPATPLL